MKWKIKSKLSTRTYLLVFIYLYFRKRNMEREQDEIKKENTLRKQEIQQLQEVIELKKKDAEREKKYLKEALEEQEMLKTQLSSDELFVLPQNIQKDIEKLRRQNEVQKRSKDSLTNEINALIAKLRDDSGRLSEKESDFERTKIISEEEKIKLERNQQNENKMSHDLLAERDRTHELQIDLTALEMQIKHSTQERKSVQEQEHIIEHVSFQMFATFFGVIF